MSRCHVRKFNANWSYEKDIKPWKAANRVKWREFISKLVQLKCVICGYEKCVSSLDFHHKDGEGKEFSISQFIANKSVNRINKIRLFEELQKCTILCANCHRELHHGDKE